MTYYYDYYNYLDKTIVPKPITYRCNNCGILLIRIDKNYLECPDCKKSYYVR